MLFRNTGKDPELHTCDSTCATRHLHAGFHSNPQQHPTHSNTQNQQQQQAKATKWSSPVAKQRLDLVDCAKADTGAEGYGAPDHTQLQHRHTATCQLHLRTVQNSIAQAHSHRTLSIAAQEAHTLEPTAVTGTAVRLVIFVAALHHTSRNDVLSATISTAERYLA